MSEKKAIFMYAESLIEAGASYVEIDYKTLEKILKPAVSQQYIFRINIAEELIVANALEFAYAVVPLRLHAILPMLEVPAILEIEIGDSDVFAVLQLISQNVDFSLVSMIRLVGDFEPETIETIITKYRRRTVIPLDICPTNGSLSALDSAICAYKSVADAVTVAFGEYERFASLEELLLMLSAVHKVMVSPHYLSGICKASIFLSLFAEDDDKKVSNLGVMIRRYMHRPISIQNIDMPIDSDEFAVKPPNMIRLRNRNTNNGAAARVLRSMGLERETREKIMEILDDCQVDISGVIKNVDDKENNQ
jgi:hypothetical protein